MRAVVNDAGICTIDILEPEQHAGGVTVSVTAAGVCALDTRLADAGVGGFVYGHEFAGRTEDGRAVFVEPTIFGGTCAECRRGDVARCREPGHGSLGVHRDGGMAERIRVPEDMLLDLPVGLDSRDACLIEPGAVAWRGLRRARLQPAERLLVIGAGTVGLLAAAAAQAVGHQVDVECRHDHQRRAADALDHGRPVGEYDVVVDAAGSASSLPRAAVAARPGGRVVSLGLHADTAPIPGPVSTAKELTYIHSVAYGLDDGVRETARVAEMLAVRPELASVLITHRFPIEESGEAFRVAADRGAGAIKVVIEP